MKRLSLLIVVILAVGCKINVDQPAATTGATSGSTATTGSTAGSSATGSTAGGTAGTTGSTTAGSKPTTGKTSKPDEKTTGGTSTTGSSTAGAAGTTGSTGDSTSAIPAPISTPTTDELKKKPGYNPSRLYQLSTLKTVNLTVNGHTLKTWIADTNATREEGLMFVRDKDITPDEAMIFVFPTPQEQQFWMKNTYIPLDIAYVGADKKVVSTATMKPFDEKNVPSHGLAKYAIEMKVGTVAALGIQKGTEINIPDSIQSQDQGQGGPPGGMMGSPGG